MTIYLNDYIGSNVLVPFGKQGEYGKEVAYDFSAWTARFGEGTIGWEIKRSADTNAYLLPSTEEGNVSVVTLTETETEYAGRGCLEVFYVNAGETEKRISETFNFNILPSLQDTGEAPAPWQPYVDAVHEDALRAEEAASSILDLTATATVDSSVGTPSVSVEVTTEDDHKNMAFAFSNIKGEQGEQGETGNGISSVSVAKTATVGNVDTYTMTVNYTDGDSDTATYDVTNGEVTEEEFRKAFPTDTASGSIASYPDGADMPVKDLKVSVTPVQDLHGYANPWPSGGGVNKTVYTDGYNTTTDGITVEVLSTCEIYVHGTSTKGSGYTTFDIGSFPSSIEGQTVTVSVNEKTDGVGFSVGSGNGNLNLTMSDTVTTKTKEYTAGGARRLVVNVRSDIANINKKYKFQLELGSTPTPWSPYSNICPITGWTGANVVRTGKNLFDKSATNTSNGYVANKYINGNTGSMTSDSDCNISEYIPVKANQTYAIYGVSGVNVGFAYYEKDKTLISVERYQITWGQIGTKTFTTPNLCAYIRLSIVKTNIDIMQLEVGSSATSYHAYSGNTYSIPFGQTVYGGTLDVTTGVLTIDRVSANLNDSSKWVTETGTLNFKYQDTLDDRKLFNDSYTGLMCSVAIVEPNNPFYARWRGATSYQFGFYDNTGTITLDDVKSWASNNLIQITYPLATSQSVQLTPTEVKSLLGQNNVFADCGDSEVEYLADVTLYIQKLTGSTEDDMVANANIANNKYFLVGSRLFFSTSAIAQGASIVVGTNCTETNLADALNALNS